MVKSMSLSTKKFQFFAMATLFLLAACVPAQVSTPDPDEFARQVAISVALTVASQNLETAEAAPVVTDTPVPTATLVVVDTPTAILHTATPFVFVPPTTVSGGGGGGGSTRPQYSCDTIRRRPFDGTIFKPGDKFDIKWTIVNNGTKTLGAGLDLKYSIGTKLMADRIVELPELEPGEQFAISFDAVAPEREGTYTMAYVVEGGLCYPATQIIVEK
jgi:hypothetical protein